MSITIKRNTGWLGMGTQIQIKVNGEKIASIAYKQHIEVELPDNKMYLKVAQTGIKSNEIEVQDGDIIEITQTRWLRMIFPLMMGINLLVIFITSLKYRITIFLSLDILLILSLFLINGFKVKVSDGRNE